MTMFFRRRTEQARALRYMAYVSDTKIDMLISQIQEPLRRSIATELKLIDAFLKDPNASPSLKEIAQKASLNVQALQQLASTRTFSAADTQSIKKTLAALDQRLSNVGADKARAAGDQKCSHSKRLGARRPQEHRRLAIHAVTIFYNTAGHMRPLTGRF